MNISLDEHGILEFSMSDKNSFSRHTLLLTLEDCKKLKEIVDEYLFIYYDID